MGQDFFLHFSQKVIYTVAVFANTKARIINSLNK